MQPARRGGPIRVVVAVAGLLIGLAALGLWRVASGSQNLPFDDGAAPPPSVQVTKNVTYSLAVPGGVPAMTAHGVPARSTAGQQVLALQCTWSSTDANGTSGLPLDVTAESTSTKAENTVGHFVAPITGRIHVDCAGWGAMFVPDSADRAFDWSGLALVVAVVALTVGAALGLSELRLATVRARDRRADDHGTDDYDAHDYNRADEPIDQL
jgi:hypothetical protein